MCPLDSRPVQPFGARIAQQAGLAPQGVRGIALRAVADTVGGTPDRLHWLADIINDFGQALRWDNASQRADDTQLIARLLHEEAMRIRSEESAR